MGVLADLVPAAQPAYLASGCNGGGTVGATWRHTGSATDSTGTLINLSGVTGVCKVVASAGGADIATFTFTGNASGFTLECDESLTAAVTPSDAYRWYFYLDDGTDVVWYWRAAESKFPVKAGD